MMWLLFILATVYPLGSPVRYVSESELDGNVLTIRRIIVAESDFKLFYLSENLPSTATLVQHHIEVNGVPVAYVHETNFVIEGYDANYWMLHRNMVAGDSLFLTMDIACTVAECILPLHTVVMSGMFVVTAPITISVDMIPPDAIIDLGMEVEDAESKEGRIEGKVCCTVHVGSRSKTYSTRCGCTSWVLFRTVEASKGTEEEG